MRFSSLKENYKREGIKENNGGVNSSMIYLIFCKNICKCHNVPPPRTAIKKKKNTFIY
jgi:hypothetical protein